MTRLEEYKHKHEQVRRYIQTRHLDGVVLTRRANFAWMTAGGLNHVGTAADLGNSSLIVKSEECFCITNAIEAPRVAAEEVAGLPIQVHPYPWHDANEAKRIWSELLGGGRYECDGAAAGLPKTVSALDPEFDTLRWSLTDAEIQRYRTLGREVGEGLEAACRAMRAGMSEHDLAAQIGHNLAPLGIRTPVVLVAADERVRLFRHPLPTARRFTSYGMGVVGGERHGLMVSASRLFSFQPIDDDLRRRHEAVCKVDAAMIAATRPGRTLGEIFSLAQKGYQEAGFPDEWKHHHQGGSTGYCGRDVRATPDNPTVVRLSQAFAWNPSIAGTKSEDTILVGPDTNEVLSATGQWPTQTYAGVARPDILVIT